MDRRSFFKRLFCGIAAVVCAPLILKKEEPEKEEYTVTVTTGYDGVYAIDIQELMATGNTPLWTTKGTDFQY